MRTLTLTVARSLLALALLADITICEAQTQTPTPVVQAPLKLGSTWKIDPAHTNINFGIRHFDISTVRGRFDDVEGTITIDEQHFENSSTQVTIKANSIDTDVPKRDDHLRTADFFHVAKFPEITFKSTSVEKTGDGYTVHGDLTIHGTTKRISLPFTISGPIPDQQVGARIGIETSITLNRKDFGINYNQLLDNGVPAVADEAKVVISLEAVPLKN